jgi:hypothetical protein
LRETNERLVYRHITVRMVTLKDLAHDSRAFGVLAVGDEAFFEHSVENAALYGF